MKRLLRELSVGMGSSIPREQADAIVAHVLDEAGGRFDALDYATFANLLERTPTFLETFTINLV
eukprot:m.20455 g.20455  ORF g.20455 m.20455 type:complete len:64 (-) comp31998_c0_seq1:69-260(-)